MQRHGPMVLRVCRAVLGPDAADDAWSDTFLSALRAYPDLPPGSNVEAWLVTIAHRKAIDVVRAESRRAVPTADLPELPSKDGLPGGWDTALWAALEALPRKQRATVAYRTVDSPLGPLLLAATEQGLLRVAYAREDHDQVLAQLASSVSARVLRAPARTDLAARELEEYFAGQRTAFDLPLDLRLSTGFRRTVLTHLADIAYGTTASYAAVAGAAGNPGAVRAVGTACATNPLPVVLPCHRVIRSDGSAGQYVGGVDAKRTLLSLESAA